uniref:Active regulator of SIRT1 n=1 Tax=Varanus komodoensis TaxID=61221 RepID=A0A8D2LP54_VARKO
MSASLLRKGLELLETTGVSSSQPKRAATTAQSNKQLLKRTKKKKLFSQSKRETSTVKGKVTKSALEEYRKCQAIDHFQENMLYMMNNQFVADSTITQKVGLFSISL